MRVQSSAEGIAAKKRKRGLGFGGVSIAPIGAREI
jgi:hypothetical protein